MKRFYILQIEKSGSYRPRRENDGLTMESLMGCRMVVYYLPPLFIATRAAKGRGRTKLSSGNQRSPGSNWLYNLGGANAIC